MNPSGFLKAQTFGMPRWAWMGLLAGGITLGLYLRRRSQAAQEAAEAEAPSPDGTEPSLSYGDTLASAAATEPGLAGSGAGPVGVVPGPSGGSVVPVQTPEIPQGFPEVFGGLGETIGALAGALVERPQAEPPAINVNIPPLRPRKRKEPTHPHHKGGKGKGGKGKGGKGPKRNTKKHFHAGPELPAERAAAHYGQVGGHPAQGHNGKHRPAPRASTPPRARVHPTGGGPPTARPGTHAPQRRRSR